METHSAKEQEPPSLMETGQSAQQEEARVEQSEQVTPAIPIVRTSTPRSPSPIFAADFPIQAPAAPPVPEEAETGQDAGSVGNVSGAATLPASALAEQDEASEFAWLFEYGLEMEPAYLNSPERLNGLAHRYGPAMVQGYELHGIELSNGRVAPTLVKCEDQEKQVWGMLYRVPRRLRARAGSAPAQLDAAHLAPTFAPVSLRVQEVYRARAINCIAYLASQTRGQAFAILAAEQHRLDNISARLVLRIGRQQGLPATYLAELAASLVTLSNNDILQATAQPPQARSEQKQQGEQNTEPLLALTNESASSVISNSARQNPTVLQVAQGGWLFALSLYLVLLLMATLALAMMQALGFGGTIFTASFSPLGAPWYVLFYGLLGGCISAMLSLGKLPRHSSRPARMLPGFVIVTWFARPFAGAILAALAYFLLNSGLFLLSLVPSQRYAAYAIVAAIAGLCEGRILFRQQ